MADLEVAPDYTPDELPHAFEPVATVVIGEGTSAPARARLVTLLREAEAFEVRLEHADEHGRRFLVTAAQEGA